MPARSSSRRLRAGVGAGASTLGVDVRLSGARWAWLSIATARREADAIARAIAQRVELPAPSVGASLVLAHDEEVHALNRRWRGMDKPTNVLSFPAGDAGCAPEDDMLFLGDVILAAETIVREAGEQAKSRRDHFRHLTTHGLLHLLGYDHETSREADAMEDLERRILADLGVADPYADMAAAPTTSTPAGRAKRNKPVHS